MIPRPCTLAAILLTGLFAACSDTPDTGTEPATGPLAAQQQACMADGGDFVRVDTNRLACVFRTPDAGRACSSAQDCTGACLARSGTCAPLTPLFGCHQIITGAGFPATECRN